MEAFKSQFALGIKHAGAATFDSFSFGESKCVRLEYNRLWSSMAMKKYKICPLVLITDYKDIF